MKVYSLRDRLQIDVGGNTRSVSDAHSPYDETACFPVEIDNENGVVLRLGEKLGYSAGIPRPLCDRPRDGQRLLVEVDPKGTPGAWTVGIVEEAGYFACERHAPPAIVEVCSGEIETYRTVTEYATLPDLLSRHPGGPNVVVRRDGELLATWDAGARRWSMTERGARLLGHGDGFRGAGVLPTT